MWAKVIEGGRRPGRNGTCGTRFFPSTPLRIKPARQENFRRDPTPQISTNLSSCTAVAILQLIPIPTYPNLPSDDGPISTTPSEIPKSSHLHTPHVFEYLTAVPVPRNPLLFSDPAHCGAMIATSPSMLPSNLRRRPYLASVGPAARVAAALAFSTGAKQRQHVIGLSMHRTVWSGPPGQQ